MIQFKVLKGIIKNNFFNSISNLSENLWCMALYLIIWNVNTQYDTFRTYHITKLMKHLVLLIFVEHFGFSGTIEPQQSSIVGHDCKFCGVPPVIADIITCRPFFVQNFSVKGVSSRRRSCCDVNLEPFRCNIFLCPGFEDLVLIVRELLVFNLKSMVIM